MDRKEQILEIATELIQTRGYSAFSYQDLSDRLGITKASIHHHFPSKAELGLAVAERYFDDVSSALAQVKRTSDDPWEQLDGYVGQILALIETRDRICAAGAVHSEFNVVPESMSVAMSRLAKYIIAWLTEILEAGRRAGVMSFPGDAENQATLVFAAAQGAMQFGRAHGPVQASQIMEQIKQLLRAA
ncbi:MAG: TetR/AcrR family transcriptional regulator [Phycisphaerales bacterium JB043]